MMFRAMLGTARGDPRGDPRGYVANTATTTSVCNKKHSLKYITTSGWGTCDGCHKRLESRTKVMECRPCNYWLCSDCYETKSDSTTPPASSSTLSYDDFRRGEPMPRHNYRGPPPPQRESSRGEEVNSNGKRNHDPYAKIFVGGLSFETKERTIGEIFAQMGQVKEVILVVDKQTRRPKGYAFVTFENEDAAHRALREMQGFHLDGRNLRLELCISGLRESARGELENPRVEDINSRRGGGGAGGGSGAESRWKMRIDTSVVETLVLGVEDYDDRDKTSVVTDAWLRFLGEKKFPKLNSLCLSRINITDAGLSEAARGWSNLQTLNLFYCSNITDASMLEVARRCSNLQTLDLYDCRNITDASVMEVARRCSNLQTLNLYGCRNITSACKNTLRQSLPNLQLRG